MAHLLANFRRDPSKIGEKIMFRMKCFGHPNNMYMIISHWPIGICLHVIYWWCLDVNQTPLNQAHLCKTFEAECLKQATLLCCFNLSSVKHCWEIQLFLSAGISGVNISLLKVTTVKHFGLRAQLTQNLETFSIPLTRQMMNGNWWHKYLCKDDCYHKGAVLLKDNTWL